MEGSIFQSNFYIPKLKQLKITMVDDADNNDTKENQVVNESSPQSVEAAYVSAR